MSEIYCPSVLLIHLLHQSNWTTNKDSSLPIWSKEEVTRLSQEFSFGEKLKIFTFAIQQFVPPSLQPGDLKFLPFWAERFIQALLQTGCTEQCVGKRQLGFALSGQKQQVQNVAWKGVKEVWWLRWQEPCAGCLPATCVHYIQSYPLPQVVCCQKPQICSKQQNKGLQNTEE